MLFFFFKQNTSYDMRISDWSSDVCSSYLFLANLGMDFASIMSAEQADALMAAGTPELLDQQPVGTGPFQLVAYQKDAVIRYKANPDYWEGKAAIDDLVFAITPDASVRYAKLQAGE